MSSLPSHAAPDADWPEVVRTLVRRTTEALGALVEPVGGQAVAAGGAARLRDPAAGAPSPADHYGATFTALALCLEDAGDARWRALLHGYLATPPAELGHAPFNRLALLLLGAHLRRVGADDGARALVAAGLDRCPLVRRYPSNNWVLLARTCKVLEAAGAGRDGQTARAAARFDRLLARWSTATGGFVDHPERPRPGEGATPLAYHAKALALMLLVQGAAPDAARARRLQRAARWGWTWMDDDGLVGGFGRSTHALFGAACVLFAGLAAVEGARDEVARRAWAGTLGALVSRLESERRDDGLLALNPNPATGAEAGWDGYMHLSVYNAYAAGLLGWALEHLDALGALQTSAGDLQHKPVERDDEAGLAVCRGARARAWFTLGGQPVQGFRRDEVELRSGALQPWRVRLDGRTCVPPPVRVATARLAAQPHLAGAMPLFRRGGALYASHRMERIAVSEELSEEVRESGAHVAAVGWGPPLRAHNVAPARGSLRWWAEGLDQLLRGGRGRREQGVRRFPLEGHEVVRAFVVDGEQGWWAHLVLLRGRESDAVFLDPHGRALMEAASGVAVRTFGVQGRGEAREEQGGATSAGLLPSTLPGARGACGPVCAWPRMDRAWLTLCGAADVVLADPPPLTLRLSPDELVTPWATLSLARPR